MFSESVPNFFCIPDKCMQQLYKYSVCRCEVICMQVCFSGNILGCYLFIILPTLSLCVCACVCVCARLKVYEAVRCHSECSRYEWRIEPWSICTINTVDDLPACGEGVQSRKIRSVSGLDLAACWPGTATHTGRSRLASVL